VSVLMPVYDTPVQLLDQAVRSILAQTFADLELLILDDGSQDQGTCAHLEWANALDPRVRMFRGEHRGLTPTLNRGLELAMGNLIARQDADDWSEPDRIARQVAFLEEHPETAVVGTAAWMHQQNGCRLWRISLPLTPAEIEGSFWGRNPFVHGSVVFRAKDALDSGGYREELRCSQDYDFFWRLSQGGRGANLSGALYHYRFSAGSVSASRAAEQAVSHHAARILAIARLKGEPENVEQALECAYRERTSELAHRVELKQADHSMLAGEYCAASKAYLRLLRSQPCSALAWAKLLRLGVFQAFPMARRACFR
jgi:glycosyltransferase involved in cell wall biosynthesis